MRLSEVEERESDFAVVLAFAAGYEELVDRIKMIGKSISYMCRTCLLSVAVCLHMSIA